MRRAPLLLALAAAGCAGAGAPAPPATPRQDSPYRAASPAPHSIEIRLDARAAKEILGALSRPKYDPTDAKVLQDLPAVKLAIRDSGRSAEDFQRDLAAAFEEEARTAVFDFRTIRTNRQRWEGLLGSISARESEISRMAAERAAALLPADRPVAVKVLVLFSFGLAGLADHLVLAGPEGRDVIIVDLARALGEVSSEPVESQLARLARLIAGGAYRFAWAEYRKSSPAWTAPDPQLGPLAGLLRIVGEAGPVALFSVDENFFPLTVWLKEPMKRSLSELNRIAERLVEADSDLDRRMELATEVQRPEFARRLAGPAGAFLADAIIQGAGIEAFRSALSKGPRAFFQAYDQLARRHRDLIPLSEVIQQRLSAEKAPSR